MSSVNDSIARIGPNSITRMDQALRHQQGDALTRELFGRANLGHHLASPPTEMVDEREVTRLHRVVRDALDPEAARAVSIEAGRLTAEYLLAVRIPRPVQALLKILPAFAASRILLTAISRNAWTFAGSGQFSVSHSPSLELSITNSPLCRDIQTDIPVCDYYCAVFEHLFQTLMHPRTRVTEIQCAAAGDARCVFAVDWSGR